VFIRSGPTINGNIAYFFIIVFSLLLGIYGFYATRKEKIRIQRNESFALVALLFISIPLMQSIPVMSYGIPFIDAWFEAVSGVTTTGLSTLGTIADRPISFLFARGWMQWVGGLEDWRIGNHCVDFGIGVPARHRYTTTGIRFQ
jgi:trk/ktr system potassium uptake protein